jgi:hypothetical protein
MSFEPAKCVANVMAERSKRYKTHKAAKWHVVADHYGDCGHAYIATATMMEI